MQRNFGEKISDAQVDNDQLIQRTTDQSLGTRNLPKVGQFVTNSAKVDDAEMTELQSVDYIMMTMGPPC